MTTIQAPVLLLGSCPGANAEQAMRLMARGAGDLVAAIPDGERDDRRYWVNYLAYRVYAPHPALETTRRPSEKPAKEHWVPSGYGDFWQFRASADVHTLRFDRLGYRDFATESYATFCRLRDAGIVPAGKRLQVCLPLTESGTRIFAQDQHTFSLMWQAYEAAMREEIAAICAAIPAEDLLIQWDVCIEVLAIATDDHDEVMLNWKAQRDPQQRYLQALQALAPVVPDAVPMGLHLCYGDLYKRHLVEPDDLALTVRMANDGTNVAGRRVDYVHLPVPIDRVDETYFQPLQQLDIGPARLYAGLIHDGDGVAGSEQRLKTFRRYYGGPLGVATECGFGGRPEESIPALLDLHRQLARQL